VTTDAFLLHKCEESIALFIRQKEKYQILRLILKVECRTGIRLMERKSTGSRAAAKMITVGFILGLFNVNG